MAPTQKYAVENLYDRVQNMLGRLLEKTNGASAAAETALFEEVKEEVADSMPFGIAGLAEKIDRNNSLSSVDTEGKVVENDLKKQFMTFLLAKDDNLLLRTSGCLLTLIMHSKVSQALLYHS